jgi:hypothetical protein
MAMSRSGTPAGSRGDAQSRADNTLRASESLKRRKTLKERGPTSEELLAELKPVTELLKSLREKQKWHYLEASAAGGADLPFQQGEGQRG